MDIPVPAAQEGFLARQARKLGEFYIKTINVPPSEHRLKNVVGLALGIYLGREIMNLTTAKNWDGSEKRREEVPYVLRPLYNATPYNPYSNDPRDRWMRVVDNGVPAALGAIGAMYGSYDFFSTRTYKNLKPVYKAIEENKPISLADASLAGSMKQAEIWRVMSAFGTMLGSSSATAWFLWPFNFGVSLGSSFNKGLDRKLGGELPEPLARAMSGFTEALEPARHILGETFNIVKKNVMQKGHLDLSQYDERLADDIRKALSRHFDHKMRTEEGRKHLEDIVEGLRKPFENLVNDMHALHEKGELTDEVIAQYHTLADRLSKAIHSEGYLENVVINAKAQEHMKLQPFKGFVEVIANWLGASQYMEKMETFYAEHMSEIAETGKEHVAKILAQSAKMAVGRTL